MKRKKLASFFLLVVALEMLLLSASDATPFFWRRRRRRRRHQPPTYSCSSDKPFNSVNDWHQYFSFRCPKDKALKVWHSMHRNCKEDRIHSFECKDPPSFPRRRRCATLPHYANDYDKPLSFKCPHDGFITGVISEYSSLHKDRRFNFRCCHFSRGYYRHSCQQTHYLNNWDQNVNFRAPNGSSLAGVFSYHENHYEDRRWKFEFCKITAKRVTWRRKSGK